MQQKETTNPDGISGPGPGAGRGAIIAVDPGMKRVGLAVSDDMRIVARPLPPIKRSSWKKLLSGIRSVIAEFDAVALVIGLPLNTDGSESEMSLEAREMARKFALSLTVPVFLQDERVSTYEARNRLWSRGIPPGKTKAALDSEAAAVILGDFLDRLSRGLAGEPISVKTA